MLNTTFLAISNLHSSAFVCLMFAFRLHTRVQSKKNSKHNSHVWTIVLSRYLQSKERCHRTASSPRSKISRWPITIWSRAIRTSRTVCEDVARTATTRIFIRRDRTWPDRRSRWRSRCPRAGTTISCCPNWTPIISRLRSCGGVSSCRTSTFSWTSTKRRTVRGVCCWVVSLFDRLFLEGAHENIYPYSCENT